MQASQALRVVGLWSLLLLSAQAADEADALPTLFDFLGVMADREGEWVDPLDMVALSEEFSELEETQATDEPAQLEPLQQMPLPARGSGNPTAAESTTAPDVEVSE